MLLVHKPADKPEVRYDLDEITAKEGGEIERVLELPWGQVEEQLRDQAPSAMLAVLWVFRRRNEPGLRYGAVDVPGFRKRLSVKLSDEEVSDMVEEISRQVEDENARQDVFRFLRKVADNPEAVDNALSGDGPKASLPSMEG